MEEDMSYAWYLIVPTVAFGGMFVFGIGGAALFASFGLATFFPGMPTFVPYVVGAALWALILYIIDGNIHGQWNNRDDTKYLFMIWYRIDLILTLVLMWSFGILKYHPYRVHQWSKNDWVTAPYYRLRYGIDRDGRLGEEAFYNQIGGDGKPNHYYRNDPIVQMPANETELVQFVADHGQKWRPIMLRHLAKFVARRMIQGDCWLSEPASDYIKSRKRVWIGWYNPVLTWRVALLARKIHKNLIAQS